MSAHVRFPPTSTTSQTRRHFGKVPLADVRPLVWRGVSAPPWGFALAHFGNTLVLASWLPQGTAEQALADMKSPDLEERESRR
jgi:hypothetical protein